ncbi:MAG: multiprotein-bridging factor 1 family protein [Thermoproteota archaeon]
MICEICGSRAPKLRRVVVEGSIVNICPDCFNTLTRKIPVEKEIPENIVKPLSKKVLSKTTPKTIEKKTGEIATNLKMELMELVDDYRALIKKRMRELGWNEEELGARTGLKVSLIRKIEAGRIVPSIPDVKKIENALKVKLLKPSSTVQEHVPVKHVSKASSSITLGDVLRGEHYEEE